MPVPSSRIEALDSMRGIFALLVMVYHALIAHHGLLNPIIRNGWLAVDYFFLLSGFVISLAFTNQLKSYFDIARFLVKRIARLWPLHFVTFLISVIIFSIQITRADGGVPLSFLPPAILDMFLLSAIRNTELWILNVPAWSISVEVIVCMIFAISIWIGSIWHPTMRRILAALMIVGAALVLCGFLEAPFGRAYLNGLYRGIFYFFIGQICWELYIFETQRDRSFGTFPEAVAIACVIGIFLLPWDNSTNIWQPWIVGLVFGGAILIISMGKGRVSEALRAAPLILLGKLSFSIYLIHAIVLKLAGIVLRIMERQLGTSWHRETNIDGRMQMIVDLGNPWVNTLVLAVLILSVIAFSLVTWRWVEQPGQRVGRRLADHWFSPDTVTTKRSSQV